MHYSQGARATAHIDDASLKPGRPAKELNGWKLLGIAQFYSSGEWMRRAQSLEQNQEYLPRLKGGVLFSIGAIIPTLKA